MVAIKNRSPFFLDYTCLINFFKNHHKDLDDKSIHILLHRYEKDLNSDRNIQEKISLFLKDVPNNVKLANLDADWNGRFISTMAMIKTISDTAPTPITAVYICEECATPHVVPMDTTEKMEVPNRCMNCGSKRLKFDSNTSVYKNYAYLKLEIPLEIRQNGNNISFLAYMEDYLATSHHNVQAGDVCNVVGWFRIRTSEKNGLEFIIEIHNITPLGKDLEENRITEKDKEEILELSENPNVFQKFVNTIAPSMYGYEDVKKALVLQLFEGLRPSENSSKVVGEDRWTIHILIIGDPGVGKSKLSQGVSLHSPKSIITNGAGATKNGLLSSATKDQLSSAWILDAGAVVLADSGLLILDEFDKLDPSIQTGLNEPMEQMSVSVAKAGIVQTLTARTSVLALANPKFSRFNETDSMSKQLDIVPSTLSRFDLTFAVRDIIDDERDEKLANAILYGEYDNLDEDSLIDDTLFKKYINYAKLNVYPRLSFEASEYIKKVFKNARKTAKETGDGKPVTARDLVGLQRLTVARAKVELREEATIQDAIEVVELYKKSLESVGLDLTTVGEVQAVRSPSESKLITDIENMIKELTEMYGLSIPKSELDDVHIEAQIRCASIKTKLNADDVFNEAYKNIRGEYYG